MGMNLLENPTTYNLSERNFSIGVAIFDVQAEEFLDANYFPALLATFSAIGSGLDSKTFSDDYKPCNTTNGDFN
jgi:hypothetical protein